MASYGSGGESDEEDFNPAPEIDEDDVGTSKHVSRRPALDEDEEDEVDAPNRTGNDDEDEEGGGIDLDNDDDDDDEDDEDDEDEDVVVCILQLWHLRLLTLPGPACQAKKEG